MPPLECCLMTTKMLFLFTASLLLVHPTKCFSPTPRTVSTPRTLGTVPCTMVSPLYASIDPTDHQQQQHQHSPIRAKQVGPRSALRNITGFSWTAFRTTMRAATGVSLTAVYATALAASGQWIRQTMRVLLSLLPAWARYFVQPVLVLYYTPLFIVRSMTAPQQRKRDIDRHVVEGWKAAVERADDKSDAYWPAEGE